MSAQMDTRGLFRENEIQGQPHTNSDLDLRRLPLLSLVRFHRPKSLQLQERSRFLCRLAGHNGRSRLAFHPDAVRHRFIQS